MGYRGSAVLAVSVGGWGGESCPRSDTAAAVTATWFRGETRQQTTRGAAAETSVSLAAIWLMLCYALK